MFLSSLSKLLIWSLKISLKDILWLMHICSRSL